MNRRKFLQWLGIGVPAAVVAAVAVPALVSSVSEKGAGESYNEFRARLGEWHNYHHESSPEIAESLRAWEKGNIYFDRETLDNLKRNNPDMYAQVVSRNIHEGSIVKREFFQYNVKS